jgi:hypothetical protein
VLVGADPPLVAGLAAVPVAPAPAVPAAAETPPGGFDRAARVGSVVAVSVPEVGCPTAAVGAGLAVLETGLSVFSASRSGRDAFGRLDSGRSASAR